MSEHFCDPRLLPGECVECLGKPRPCLAGVIDVPVEIVGRTAKRVRVRFLDSSCGRRRGEVRLVAPDAVRWPAGGAR